MVKPLIPPIANFTWLDNTSQLFGVNKDFYMPKFGIPGHNGIDIAVHGQDNKNGFGTKILATHDGVVEKMKQDVPFKTNGNGIYILDTGGRFSTVYWHLSQFHVNVGDKVTTGQVIGLMGNSGYVFPEPSPSCPYCGTHLHFSVYVHGLDNEYGGFTDPVPWIIGPPKKLPIQFSRDLTIGYSGNDVSWLQTCLKLENLAENYDPTGYFGNQTRKDVIKLQEIYGLSPTIGYVGPKTRNLLNKRWSVYYS